MKKVLDYKIFIICSPQLGLSPKSILGGEVFDREILLGLAKRGVRINIILPRGREHGRHIKNWEITYLPISRFPAIFANLFYLFPIFKMYQKNEFQVLRLHHPQFLVFAAFFIKLFHQKIKILATYHQFRESKFLFFSRLINNFWDYIVVDSERVKSQICSKYSVPDNKITVVHNGVPSYLKPAKKDKALVKKLDLNKKFILLFMGIFIPRKNPLFLIEVLSKLSQAGLNIVLVLWGDGPLKAQIIQKAKAKGVEDKIRIIDPVFGTEKNKIHNLADIFVHPSLDEGFALAPLEAMSCAKPVIMNALHSAREAINEGENGFICQSNSVKDWSKRIMILYKNRSLLSKMGKRARAKAVADFNWKKSVDSHLKLFKNLKV